MKSLEERQAQRKAHRELAAKQVGFPLVEVVKDDGTKISPEEDASQSIVNDAKAKTASKKAAKTSAGDSSSEAAAANTTESAPAVAQTPEASATGVANPFGDK